MADWKKFELAIPGKDVLEPVREVLETLLVYLDILKAILETIKTFLVDFGNPIKALVEALIKLIIDLLEALRQTGIYAYFDIPEPDLDPNFNKNAGGYQAFTERFKASLMDSRDPNRPKPIPSFNQGEYVVLMVNADSVTNLIRLIRTLLRFFGKEFTSPRYEAPLNFQVVPVGSSGDPILAVTKIFKENPSAFAVEWMLPTTHEVQDPGFQDMVGQVAAEFVPPKYLIEISTRESTEEIDVDALKDDDATGRVVYQKKTSFEVRGKTVERKEQLTDAYGEPVIKFQRAISIDTSDPTFWLGMAGHYRYIFTGVPYDTTMWLRVRAYSGDLAWKDEEAGILDYSKSVYQDIKTQDGAMVFKWPSNGDEPVMGISTGVVRVRLPKLPDKFDVIESLRRLFQTAFALNFHLPAPVEKDATGMVIRPLFDAQGDPIDPTQVSDIGVGSLKDYAGPLAVFDSLPYVGYVSSSTSLSTEYKPDEITGQLPKMPWQELAVRYRANALAIAVGSALLEAGSDFIQNYQDLMQGSLPYSPMDIGGALEGVTSIEEAVFALTDLEDNGDLLMGGVSRSQALSYGQAFHNKEFRQNILQVVSFIKTFTLSGNPPNWITVSLLRDIVPWSGSMLYWILDAIQALLDAYSGVLDDIKAFIDLLLRKIEALERFIESLVRLMEFIMQLDFEVYTLKSGVLTGGVEEWMSTIDNAGGDVPPKSPGGYSAGVVFAYVAPDISAISHAFELIFGA